MNVRACSALLKELGVPIEPRLLREELQTAYVAEEVRELLGLDVISIYERPPLFEQQNPARNGVLVSEWGIEYVQRQGPGSSYSLSSFPLKDAGLADIEEYPWPDPLSNARFQGLEEEATERRGSPYAVVGNLARTEIFGVAWYLRGFYTFTMDLVANKELAHVLLRRITDFQKKRFKALLDIVGSSINILLFAEDLAGQQGLLLSPEGRGFCSTVAER